MSLETPVKKVHHKPSNDDGVRYHFNCCPSPNVWVYSDFEKRCRVCGHNWTSELE